MPTYRSHLNGSGSVARLEQKLREHYGMRHALSVSSATTGLLAIALALKLRNTEFVAPPYTYGASLAGWLLLGNRPIFADIDSQTVALDPESARRLITARTRAMLAVDMFGIPSDTVALRRLADEYGIWYIADAAQSFGAQRGGLPASALADALVVSFTCGKTLSTGEGGAVLTNHSGLYEKLVWWTQHPQRQHRDLVLDNEFGLNGRIHPFSADRAVSLFEGSLAQLRVRQAECFRIIEALNEIGLTEPVRFARDKIEPSFFQLTAAWRKEVQEDRLLTELSDRGFTAGILPAPARLIYRQPAFLAQYGRRMNAVAKCSRAERQARRRFSLAPFYFGQVEHN